MDSYAGITRSALLASYLSSSRSHGKVSWTDAPKWRIAADQRSAIESEPDKRVASLNKPHTADGGVFRHLVY